MLWPDTFTNHLAPAIGRAAVEVLEAAGWRVIVPSQPLCCGLTWISTGQLATARRVLQRTVRRAGPVPAARRQGRRAGAELHGGVPVRRARADARQPRRPAAAAADRHAGRAAAGPHRRLAAAARWAARRSRRPTATSTPSWATTRTRRCCAHAGVDLDVLDAGCCGLAGNFGFEAGHYDVSRACGERVLLPAVRDAAADTLVLADGFSCRTQIEQAGTGRTPGTPGRDPGRRAARRASTAVPPHAAASRRLRPADRDRRGRRGSRRRPGGPQAEGVIWRQRSTLRPAYESARANQATRHRRLRPPGRRRGRRGRSSRRAPGPAAARRRTLRIQGSGSSCGPAAQLVLDLGLGPAADRHVVALGGKPAKPALRLRV